jgi:putative ABC transport system permease protein
MINDLRYAVRVLLRRPRFTCAALAALALGIGATTAMFAAVNNVLLRPLPYPDAERLYVVRETRAQAGFERTVVAEGEFLAWMRDSPVIEHAAAVEYPALAVRIGAAPERIPALRVAADFFPLFGISAAVGRTFTRDAEQPGKGNVIVLGHGLWRRRFGGTTDAIGRAITVDGRPMTIVGVLPDSFLWNGPVDAIVPKTLGPEQSAKMSDHYLDVYARLRTGTTPEEASAMLTAAVTNGQGAPAHATGAALVPLRQEIVGESATPMGILFASVGLVLLIACANIASLLLARATARQKEIAVRSALGATRARVIRQLVTESVLLSVAGGVIGSIVASWLSTLLGKVASGSIPRAAEIGMDVRALTFAFGTSALCGVLFGIVPAWHSSRSG